MSSPRFSIVIPAWNVERWLPETIASVRAQTVTDWELIIVDDGSTDGTAAIVKGLDDARVRLISQPNSGVSIARNRGISEARGEFIAFLDADDLWSPTHLQRAQGYFESFPEGQWYAGRKIGATQPPGGWDEGLEVDEHCYFADSGDFLPNSSSVVLRRSFISDIPELFPAHVPYGEDIVAWARLACKNPIFGSGKVVSVFYRCRQGSAMETRSSNKELERENRYLALHDELVLPSIHSKEARLFVQMRILQGMRGIMERRALKSEFTEMIDRYQGKLGPVFTLWIRLFTFLLRVLVWAFKQPMQHYLVRHRAH